LRRSGSGRRSCKSSSFLVPGIPADDGRSLPKRVSWKSSGVSGWVLLSCASDRSAPIGLLAVFPAYLPRLGSFLTFSRGFSCPLPAVPSWLPAPILLLCLLPPRNPNRADVSAPSSTPLNHTTTTRSSPSPTPRPLYHRRNPRPTPSATVTPRRHAVSAWRKWTSGRRPRRLLPERRFSVWVIGGGMRWRRVIICSIQSVWRSGWLSRWVGRGARFPSGWIGVLSSLLISLRFSPHPPASESIKSSIH
jgi:hypothetical protein